MFGAARRCGPVANVYSARVSRVTSGAGWCVGGLKGWRPVMRLQLPDTSLFLS